MSFFEIFKAFINSAAEILPLSGNAQTRIADMIYYPLTSGNAMSLAAALADFGGMAAVVYVFRKKILLLLKAFWGMLGKAGKKAVNAEDKKEIKMLLIASCPILAAIFLKSVFGSISRGWIIFVIALAVSGAMLFAADKFKGGEAGAIGVPLPDALMTGAFRLLGFIPGMSGTAAALFGGALSGFSADFNCEFTFLTLIPVLLGKGIYNLSRVKADPGISVVSTCILVGFAVFAFGAVGIGKTRDMIFSGKLKLFSYILWAEALLALILSVRG